MLTQRDVRSLPLAFSSHQGESTEQALQIKKTLGLMQKNVDWSENGSGEKVLWNIESKLNAMIWKDRKDLSHIIHLCHCKLLRINYSKDDFWRMLVPEQHWSPLTLNVWTNEDRIFIFGYYFKMHNIAYFPNNTLVQSIKIIVYWNQTIILYTQKFYILWPWEMTANVKMCRISKWRTNEYILKKKSRLIMSSFTLVMKS